MAAILPPLPVRSAAVPPPLPPRGTPPPLPGQLNFQSGQQQSTRDVPFLAGGAILNQWIAIPDSTNVNRIRCDQDIDLNGNRLPTGTIYIEFLNLSLYQYNNRPMNDFVDLFTSSSKGRYTHFEVRGPGPSRPGMGIWPAIKLRGPLRSAAQTRRIARARQPRTQVQRLRYYNVGGRARAGGGYPSRPYVA